MNDQSEIFSQPNSKAIANVTSSPESVDGPLLYDSPDGLSLFPCGPAPAPVSHSRRRGSGKANPTSGTCGLSSSGSSASASLQSSLASKLQALMGCDGSMEYSLTWKERVTPAGRRICALRASARRTSASDCSGWATPVSNPAGGTPEQFLERKKKAIANGASMGIVLSDLQMQAIALAGWPTPRTQDERAESWETQRARDASRRANGDSRGCGQPGLGTLITFLAADVAQESQATDASIASTILVSLPVIESSPAETENRGVLAPEFPRWLMGYPAILDSVSPHFAEYCQVQDAIAQGG